MWKTYKNRRLKTLQLHFFQSNFNRHDVFSLFSFTHIAPTLLVRQMSPHGNTRGASGHSRWWPVPMIDSRSCQLACFGWSLPPGICFRASSPSAPEVDSSTCSQQANVFSGLTETRFVN
uniref:(northern house mosquito) hypothetical protein n=1 Tax=Culex pipiens TaxID=7175 RepID=A0A8D8F2P8_CULPI